MTGIRSDGGATREDAIRRATQAAEKRESELELKHREELRSLRDAHREDIQKLESTLDDRMEKERSANRERLSEQDARHRREIEEMQSLHRRQLIRNASEAAEADARSAVSRPRSRERT